MPSGNTSSRRAKRLIPREEDQTPTTERFTASDRAKLNSLPFGGSPSGPPGPPGPLGCPGSPGSPGTLTIKEEDVIVASGVDTLDFLGHVDVFSDSTGEVDIEVPLDIDGGTF